MLQIRLSDLPLAILAVAAMAGTGTVSAQTADFGVKLQPFSQTEKSSSRAGVASPTVMRGDLVSEPIKVAYYRPTRPSLEVPDGSEAPSEEFTSQLTTSRSSPTVAGNYAVLRRGVAYAPARAPANVKNAIWAVNTLRRKPYVWGGGHRSFDDRGYDCSGTVSYALHHAGLLNSPMPSSDFVRYGERGLGRWITVYARRGHTFAVIAGLRLDTTNTRNGGDVGPRWFVDGRDVRNFEARHPAGW